MNIYHVRYQCSDLGKDSRSFGGMHIVNAESEEKARQNVKGWLDDHDSYIGRVVSVELVGD